MYHIRHFRCRKRQIALRIEHSCADRRHDGLLSAAAEYNIGRSCRRCYLKDSHAVLIGKSVAENDLIYHFTVGIIESRRNRCPDLCVIVFAVFKIDRI